MGNLRGTIREMDNRDMEESWLHINKGEQNIVEVSREEAMNLLEGFYVNQARGENGQLNMGKLAETGKDLQIALQELHDWVCDLVLQCDFDIDCGTITRQDHEKMPEEDFKESFPELVREMRRG